MAPKVLHITPHMGGGVGRVLKGLTETSMASGSFAHSIVCLDYANDDARRWSRASGVPVQGDAAQDRAQLARNVAHADLVQLHWWNHPLVYAFLFDHRWPACRTALWAHVNGYHPPHLIHGGLLDYADSFVLGTPYSRDIPAVQARSAEWRAGHLRAVLASSGYDHVAHVVPRGHAGFNIGYIGTVDYGKMHSDFLTMNAAANIPGGRWIVCGGNQEAVLRRQAAALNVADRFEIRGHVSDISSVLAELDVFGYPLQAHHYGASEIALIEAMACGVVPVVLDHGCEAALVSHGRSGIVAATPREYAAALEFLYRHCDVRRQMAARARAEARTRFARSLMVQQWHAIYEQLLERPKRRTCLRLPSAGPAPVRPWEMFLAALGSSPTGRLFHQALASPAANQVQQKLAQLEPVFFGSSNGSVRQYRAFFPHDRHLQRLEKVLSQITRQRTAA